MSVLDADLGGGPPRGRRWRTQALAWWPLVMAAAALAYVLVGVWVEASASTVALGSVLAVLVGGLATASVLLTIEAETRPSARRARRLLGAALFLWTLAESYRALVLALTRAVPGIPSVSELLRLAGYLSVLAAAVSYSASSGGRYGRLRDLLDTSILILAGSSLAWLVILRPVSMALPSPGVLLGWAAVAPIFDLVLIFFALRLLLGAETAGEARGFVVIATALAVLLLADLVRGYLTLGGEIELPTLAQGSWGMAISLIGMMAPRTPAGRPAGQPEEVTARPLRQRMESVLPIALTYAVVGFTLFTWWLLREIDWAGVGAAAVLSLLLMARQGVIGGQSEMHQFAALVNASADLAFVCQDDGLIHLSNPAVQSALRAATTPANLADMLATPTPSRDFLRQAIRSGWSGEVELRRADGTRFPASLSLRPVWDERLGRALLVGTAHDLTHIRQREDDLRAALSQVAVARSDLEALNAVLERRVAERTQQLAETVDRLHRMNLELQELGRLKSEFVTLVSHELRAPLTNIRAGIELTLATNPNLDRAVEERLALVASETDRLSRFVEAILDLSALEAGRFPLHPGPVEVAATAEQVAERLRAQRGENRIVIDIPHSLPAVLADERALDSAFFHLLDNALKYAPEGEIRVQARVDLPGVQVSVIDHGPGIPEDERERVFEMFHRLDSRDAREVYGHGLGLHLTRQLLSAMGGWIRAEAEEGGGTRMVFWLPQAEGQA